MRIIGLWLLGVSCDLFFFKALLPGSRFLRGGIVCPGLSPNETVDALKEAKLLQSLKHPNVVGYYDAFVQEGHFVCIVMEYCECAHAAAHALLHAHAFH